MSLLPPRPLDALNSILSSVDSVRNGYGRSLAWVLDHAVLTMLVLAATIALNIYLYVVIPKGFFPQQDTSRLIGNIQADQGISFQAMQQKLRDFVSIVRADPAVENVVGSSSTVDHTDFHATLWHT